MQITGSIKWFDPCKGYGFLGTEDGDVFIHDRVIRAAGYYEVLPGTKYTVIVEEGEKGARAAQVLSVDSTCAIEPRGVSSKPLDNVTTVFEPAYVRWFNREKGYGFVNFNDGSDDIFVNMEALRNSGLASIQPGKRVLITWGDSDQGPMVHKIMAG